MNKGFVIMAQNTDQVDYVKCAEQLKNSIQRCMPDANVTIIKSSDLPYGDLGGFYNDWQVYEASPYEFTIKLEADMVIPSSIDFWWDICKDRDIIVCSTIRDFKGTVSKSRYYRQFLDDNQLPDVYNAITYFKKSDNAKLFFTIVKDIFENWEEWKKTFVCNDNEPASTDWVYSIACHIMGVENTTLPSEFISMVHMKQHINNLVVEDWTKQLIYELTDTLKINTIVQQYPFHYHIKEFSTELGKYYD